VRKLTVVLIVLWIFFIRRYGNCSKG